jgi:hypothetical protein
MGEDFTIRVFRPHGIDSHIANPLNFSSMSFSACEVMVVTPKGYRYRERLNLYREVRNE